MIVQRVNVEELDRNDGNILPRYPIEFEPWVWLSDDDHAADEFDAVSFRLDFVREERGAFEFELSADQCYDLFCDGCRIGSGPDRGDVMHWGFVRYRGVLEPGEHRIEVHVLHAGEAAPHFRTGFRSGFIFAGGELGSGSGRWRASRIHGIRRSPRAGLGVVGEPVWIDGGQFSAQAVWREVVIVRSPPVNHGYGALRPGWRLAPSCLPEQRFQKIAPGPVRCVFEGDLATAPSIRETPAALPRWESEAGQSRSMIIDFKNYYGFRSHLVTAGEGSVELIYSESFYEAGDRKGDRSRIDGKRIFPETDGEFSAVSSDLVSGSADVCLPWLRAGRYVTVILRGNIRLETLDFYEIGYPLDFAGSSRFEREELNRLVPFFERGMLACSHDSFVDCPYYEQLTYVGDSRLTALVVLARCRDAALVRRVIQLFDFSAEWSGLVAEHFPGRIRQQSLTYALIWVWMVKDYAWWRRPDAGFMTDCLLRIRSMLPLFERYRRREDGLLGPLPGWSFCDWVPEWKNGVTPGAEECSALINLHYLLALQIASELESAFGDPAYQPLYAAAAAKLAPQIRKTFFVPARGLLADDPGHRFFSEHTQCLGLLSGLFAPEERPRLRQELRPGEGMAKTTCYFSSYLFDAAAMLDAPELLFPRLALYQEMVDAESYTPWERPEPSRSDCHAWSSHSLYHYSATIAGIRPAAAGFREVSIRPLPGDLREIDCRVPHPDGMIVFHFSRDTAGATFQIELPAAISGTLNYANAVRALVPGKNTFRVDR